MRVFFGLEMINDQFKYNINIFKQDLGFQISIIYQM